MLAAEAPLTWEDQVGNVWQVPRADLSKLLKFSKYRRLREYIHYRDRETCRECGATGTELHIDHVIARHDGGAHHPDNLQLLCARCHGRKTGGEWRRRMGSLQDGDESSSTDSASS